MKRLPSSMSRFEILLKVFSVLLIIGGDVVVKAIAQLSGRKYTLVAFSFGWVAYSFSALMSAFGDGTFMPRPDSPGSVIVVGSRNKKTNDSWVIGRLIRDLERKVENDMQSWQTVPANGEASETVSEGDSGLIVSIYEACPGAKSPAIDKVHISFFIFLVFQFVVAAIPTILWRDWSIITITTIGTVLAITTGSLREWRLEKYSGREKSPSSYILTRGNGHRHVFVVMADEQKSGLYLDDLAGAVTHATTRTRLASSILAALWIAFLVAAGGLKDHTWFLLGVGALGMIQNVAVAGLPRTPAAHGIPLSEVKCSFGKRMQNQPRPKVMQVLFDVEKEYPGLGLAIRPEFFQDFALRPDEVTKWEERQISLKTRKADKKREKEAAAGSTSVVVVESK